MFILSVVSMSAAQNSSFQDILLSVLGTFGEAELNRLGLPRTSHSDESEHPVFAHMHGIAVSFPHSAPPKISKTREVSFDTGLGPGLHASGSGAPPFMKESNPLAPVKTPYLYLFLKGTGSKT